MRLVCLADTHGLHQQLRVPDGDVLIHCGDFSRRGRRDELIAFNRWLGSLPHPHKIVIAGNHDFLFEQAPASARTLLSEALYLEDSGVEIKGLYFWGSPVSPRFFDWAFNRTRGAEIALHWQAIPAHTDVLLTHTPPYGLCDRIHAGRHVGCEALRQRLDEIQPLALICGHIHESRGQTQYRGIQIINAASLSGRGELSDPWCIDIDPLSRRVLAVNEGA